MLRSQKWDPTRLAILFVILLSIVLVAARQDAWMTFLLSIAPLWLAVGGAPAPEPADEADLDQVVERLHEVQESAWRRLGTLARIIDVNHPDRGVWVGADVAMPLVESWPQGWSAPTHSSGGVATANGLTTAHVDKLLHDLHGDHRRLVVLGGEHTGKTSALLGLFLWAQHERSFANREARHRQPLPLRISVAGWPVDDPNQPLLTWVVSRLQEDYPGLLAHGASLEELLTPIWESDRRHGDRLTLFIDGIDTIVDDATRVALLRHLIAQTDGRSVALACRQETWSALSPSDRDDWSELTLAAPAADDVRVRLTGTDPSFVDRLIDAGPSTEWLRENPRMLLLLKEIYAGEPVPGWLTTLTPAGSDEHSVLMAAWSDVLAHIRWPDSLSTDRAVGTLRWMSREKLFASSRFAWWHVPGVARSDPSLAPAYRSLLWRRAGSAVAWALGAFGLGVLLLIYLLRSGAVQGYDRANGGVTRATGLGWSDVHEWPWRSGRFDASGLVGLMVSNPVYLAIFIAAVTAATVLALARCGGEFEHRDGGQPQTIRLGLPQWGDNPLRLGLPRRTLPVLFVLVVAVLLVTLTGVGVGPAARAWPGLVFAGLLILVLVWLQWSAGESEDFTPAGTFASDLEASRAVALVIGVVTAGLSAGLSWWLTSPGYTPTLGQSLWIIASVSTAAGLARGFYLGAGMGVTLLLPVRKGFGIGYAARLRLLQEALARRPIECAPTSVIELFSLAEPGGGSGSGSSSVGGSSSGGGSDDNSGLLLRPVGPLIRLRESSLDRYLSQTASPVVVKPSWPALRTGGGLVALGAAASVALLTCTGTAAEVFPGLPCSHGNGSVAGSLRNVPHSTAWLENGQCVGFTVLDEGGEDFSTRGLDLSAAGNDPERARARILAQITRQNQNLPDDTTMTVLFLAPLSRTSGSHSINALWQLEGAARAQRDINSNGAVNVRLVVANSGENFISGASVVQAVNRAFPHNRSGSWSIRAVIGIAQSRTIAREALAQLDKVDIVAASVNGGAMRRGDFVGSGKDFGNLFVSVSPSDQQVAAAMLSPAVLGRASAMLPDPRLPAASLRVIRDPDDTYFSKELSNDLITQGSVLKGPSIASLRSPSNLREADPSSVTRGLAREMCSAANRQTIWLMAGRGNQMADLDHAMTSLGLANCQPVVLAGPGAISAVATSDVEDAHLDHMQHLLFYSLVPSPPTPVAADKNAIFTAQASDQSTGYASLVESVRRLSTGGSRNCPPAAPDVAQIGMSFPTAATSDGHNTLGASTDGCGSSTGSSVYFCPFRGATGCAAPATPGEPPVTKPSVVTASADRGLQDPGDLRWYDKPSGAPRADGLAWDTKDIKVLCAVPGETTTDGWVGVYIKGRSTGFIHWKVKYAMQNRYLQFDVPGFSPTNDKISSHVPTSSCRTTDQLDKRAAAVT